MEKNDYLDILKSTDLRPKRINVEDRREEVLIEKENEDAKKENLSELFIQAGEIQSMAPGPRRNMQMLRLAISAELDAANLYEAFAELTDNMDIRKVMLEVANEEKAHIGEFEFLLEHIDVDHEKNEEEGEEEVKDLTGLGEYPGEE